MVVIVPRERARRRRWSSCRRAARAPGHRRGARRRARRVHRRMSGTRPLQLAILISGRGSQHGGHRARLPCGQHRRATSCRDLRPRRAPPGWRSAPRAGTAAATVAATPGASASFEARTRRVALDAHSRMLIVLAGFMRILSAAFVARYLGSACSTSIPRCCPPTAACTRIAACSGAGDSEHGASVHFVTAAARRRPGRAAVEGRGAQRATPKQTLAARVQATEHIIYPRVLGWFAHGGSRGAMALRGSTAGGSTRPWWRISVRQRALIAARGAARRLAARAHRRAGERAARRRCRRRR